MKIAIIQPSFYRRDGSLHKEKYLNPILGLTLPHLAGLIGKEHETELIYDSCEEIENKKYDAVFITAMSPQIERAYEISKMFKARKTPVIIGGMHPSFYPNEVSKKCDSVVIGEAETTIKNLMTDLKNKKLKKIYKSKNFCELKNIPLPRYDLIKKELIQKGIPYFFPVQATRGCNRGCEFCCVPKFYKKTHRTRPINEVIRDIKEANKYRKVSIIDDNLIVNKSYVKKLLKEISKLKINFFAQADCSIVKDEELINLLAKSGCEMLYIGLETINEKALKKQKKYFNQIQEYRKLFKLLRKAGIIPFLSMMFGFEEDDKGIFRENLEFLQKNNIPLAHFWIFTPIPGTEQYKKFLSEGKIIKEKNIPVVFKIGDGTHSTFKHPSMSKDYIEEEYWKTFKKFYSLPSIIKRIIFHPFSSIKKTLFLLITNLYMRRKIRKRIHPLS